MSKDNTLSCAAANLYESLVHCKGETVLPGIRPEVYAIPKSQIVSFPTLPKPSDENVTMEDIATYEGDFVLAADACFIRLSVITAASTVTSTSQGEPPSKTFINSATLTHESTGPKATGFCRMANSDDLVYVLRQRDGLFRVLGNDSFETDTKPSQDSGMNVTDASGTQLEVSVTDLSPAPYYKGKLKTDIGTIDCSTGKIVADAA